MVTILFLHGFFASGSCDMARQLRKSFEGRYRVLTPDLPLHPEEALDKVFSICGNEYVDLIVGNSCGSFYGQMAATAIGKPALLGNPYFKMTDFLTPRIGPQTYKARRRDGHQNFVIDQQLIDEFDRMQKSQFDLSFQERDGVWGLFGEHDTLAHFEPLFLEHFTHSFHFPGGHTPTAEEVRLYYVPLIERMLHEYVDDFELETEEE